MVPSVPPPFSTTNRIPSHTLHIRAADDTGNAKMVVHLPLNDEINDNESISKGKKVALGGKTSSGSHTGIGISHFL